MSEPFNESERGRNDIHFAVPYKYVSVASETSHALVFVKVVVISVEEVSVADD